MTRYTLYKETAEISDDIFKKLDGDTIKALLGKDRDSMEAVKSFDKREEALAELKKYSCTYYLTKGFANVYFYACEYWYIEEEEYNEDYEEWEPTGNSDFAEIATEV